MKFTHIFVDPLLQGMVCSTKILTGNSPTVFKSVIPNLVPYTGNSMWSQEYAPYCDGIEKCSEYENVPADVSCQVAPPSNIQRLCKCINKGN